VAAGLLVALAGFYFSPAGLRLRARVRWSIEDAAGGARLLLWRDTLRMASERPLRGFGTETFALNFPRKESSELARAYPDFYQESPHNIFLDALVSEGLLGLLVAFAYVCLGFYAAIHARREHPLLAPMLGSCLAAVLVAQQFTSFVAPNALYYGLLLAILVSLTPADASEKKAVRIGLLPRAIAMVCGFAVFLLLGMHLLLADYYLGRVRSDLEKLSATAAMDDYVQVIDWRRAGFSGDLYYSREMAALAAKASSQTDQARYLSEALTAGLRATETSEDRQNAWYSVASVYAAQDNAAGVQRSLRSAIAWGPNWFKPHWILAQVLRAGGQLEEAQAEAEMAAKLNSGKNPEVNQTLDQIRVARQTGKQ
jgi:tetratricopeptide (TPR) repeat protein